MVQFFKFRYCKAMIDPLHTILLEYEKSTFNISLISHKTGHLYVEIEQVIHVNDTVNEFHRIKINPAILVDVIEALKSHSSAIPQFNNKVKSFFSENRKADIISRYLKGGVSTKDLSIQFRRDVKMIEQVLTNAGIELVDNRYQKELNSLPSKRTRFKRKRKF